MMGKSDPNTLAFWQPWLLSWMELGCQLSGKRCPSTQVLVQILALHIFSLTDSYSKLKYLLSLSYTQVHRLSGWTNTPVLSIGVCKIRSCLSSHPPALRARGVGGGGGQLDFGWNFYSKHPFWVDSPKGLGDCHPPPPSASQKALYSLADWKFQSVILRHVIPRPLLHRSARIQNQVKLIAVTFHIFCTILTIDCRVTVCNSVCDLEGTFQSSAHNCRK